MNAVFRIEKNFFEKNKIVVSAGVESGAIVAGRSVIYKRNPYYIADVVKTPVLSVILKSYNVEFPEVVSLSGRETVALIDAVLRITPYGDGDPRASKLLRREKKTQVKEARKYDAKKFGKSVRFFTARRKDEKFARKPRR
jgi:hypothetical protein